MKQQLTENQKNTKYRNINQVEARFLEATLKRLIGNEHFNQSIFCRSPLNARWNDIRPQLNAWKTGILGSRATRIVEHQEES